MERIRKQIEKFNPWNEQEQEDKKVMLGLMDIFKNDENMLTRANRVAHFTASAWAVNPTRTKALLVHHNIMDSWTWTGGHADGEKDFLRVAIRELKEETGVSKIKVIDDQIFTLDINNVTGHVKRGKYVSSHVHLNLGYLLEVNEDEKIQIKPDENSGVKWVRFEDLSKIGKTEWDRTFWADKFLEKMRARGEW